MPAQQFSNNFNTTLNGGITSGATSLVVNSATGSPASAPFTIMTYVLSASGVISNSEIMLVTAGAGTTTWTVSRGQEGTAAVSHANGEQVSQIWTVAGLQSLGQAFWPTLAPSGLTGATNPTRWVGGTTSGPPVSGGPFLAGDFVIDASGAVFVCSSPGSPGSWSGWRIQTVKQVLTNLAFVNTTSTSFVEVDPSLRTTVTVPASGIVRVRQSAVARVGGVPEDGYLGVQVDGVGGVTTAGAFSFDQANVDASINGDAVLTGLTPGSHTFYMMWHSANGNTLAIPANTRAAAAAGSYQMVTTQP